VQGTRSNGLLTAGLATSALVLAVLCLRSAPDPALVARWWPATALATAVLIIAPARLARLLAGLAALLFLTASLVSGHDVVFSIGFAIANAVEALLVLRWLTGFEADRPQLRSWTDFRRWLVGITVASCAAGAITAMTIGIGGGENLWRPLLWIAVTHLGAQAVVLPLVMRQPQHKLKIPMIEVTSHVALLALVALACREADRSEPVAFLLLPLLMWSAARFTPRWANLELLAVTVGIASLTVMDRGPFADVTGDSSVLGIAASSQAFVAVGAITSVAFSVAIGHLRDSLRRIRENELQLGQLLDSASGTAFIATDLDGLITWFSPGAEQLLGYAGEEIVNRLTPMPFHESREILARAQELRIPSGYGVVTHAVAGGVEQDTRDWTYVRKDGSRLTVSLSVTAVRDDDGRPLSYLSVVRDVTDRRAAEQALVFALDKERETNHRMLELDRAKGEFVSAVSHELRTPLTSIVGYTELLADDLSESLTENQHQLVERIDRNGERLLHLVEDLLTLARVEEGSLTMDPVPTDMRAAVRAATDEVSHAAHKRRVSMRVILPSEPVLLQGDPEYLERAVLNLVSNAVKFTPAGGVVEVLLDTGRDVAELRVVDNGMGIPIEEQGQLFQRFFRSTLATEHAIQGTGLGLHIVRSIAEAHNGSVDVESTLGIGSTFRFVVPLAASVVQQEQPDEEPAMEPAHRVEEPVIEAAQGVEAQAREPAHRAGQRS
jgi:PAS domain S-box-containing protein